MSKGGICVFGDELTKVVLCHCERGGEVHTFVAGGFIEVKGCCFGGRWWNGVKGNEHLFFNGNIAQMGWVGDRGTVTFRVEDATDKRRVAFNRYESDMGKSRNKKCDTTDIMTAFESVHESPTCSRNGMFIIPQGN